MFAQRREELDGEDGARGTVGVAVSEGATVEVVAVEDFGMRALHEDVDDGECLVELDGRKLRPCDVLLREELFRRRHRAARTLVGVDAGRRRREDFELRREVMLADKTLGGQQYERRAVIRAAGIRGGQERPRTEHGRQAVEQALVHARLDALVARAALDGQHPSGRARRA